MSIELNYQGLLKKTDEMDKKNSHNFQRDVAEKRVCNIKAILKTIDRKKATLKGYKEWTSHLILDIKIDAIQKAQQALNGNKT